VCGATIDGLAVRKSAVRSNRNCVGVMRVGVIIHVNVVNDIHVTNISVMDVDVVPVVRSRVIPRMVGLAPT
jgi:hypothetical protein